MCVGGRPGYEFRSFNYKSIADASDLIFIMGYDMIYSLDYTCLGKLSGICSCSEDSIKELELGVQEYVK